MASDLQPSDYFPGFTWERLMIVARMLVDTRQWVAEQAVPERGDSRTGVGFRAWEHGRHAIIVANASGTYPWLGLGEESAHFVFTISSMPVRFYRGDCDEPVPENYADPDEAEVAQIGLALTGMPGIEFNGYYRLIVEADAAGFPRNVKLVGVDFDNVVRMAWEIPLSEAAGGTPITVPQSPVPLPPLEMLTVAEAEREEQERKAREEAERAEQERKSKQNTNQQGA